MATELGQAYVQIMPSAKGIGKNTESLLNGELGSAGTSAGESVGKNLMSGIKKMIAAAGIGKILKDSIMEGANLEQNIGGAYAVFGEEMYSAIESKARDAYKNMGLSASDYYATANKMGSLFQGSGLSQVKSLEMTEAAMQRAADVASVMGIDTSMAMESIAGAAKGNFTMMDNLGVAMNATTLSAYALEKGINFNWNTASNAEKAELAMKMFMDRTSQYEGNFARESAETFSGSLAAMRAGVQNLLGSMSLGQDLGPALQGLTGSLIDFAKNALRLVGNIITGLPEVIAYAVPTIITTLQTTLQNITSTVATSLPTFLHEFLPKVLAFTSDLRSQVGSFIDTGIELLQGLISGMVASIPDLLANIPKIIINIAGLVNDNVPKLIKAGITMIISMAKGLWDNRHEIIKNLGSILEALISVVGAINWVGLGKNIITFIGNGVKNLASHLPTILKDIGNKALNFVKNINWVQLGRDIINGIVRGISAVGGLIKDMLMSLAASALRSVKSFLGIGSPSKVFAKEVGQWIPAGIATGIEKNADSVTGAMEDIVDMTTGSITSDVALATSAQAMQLNGGYIPAQDGHNTLEAKLATIIDLLAAGHTISINGERMAAAIAVDMDAALGSVAIRKERG